MSLEAGILSAIDGAVAETNLQLPPDRRLEPAPETPLLGDGGALDSLAFLGFLIALEERLAESLGRPIRLVGEELVPEGGAGLTIGQLRDHLERKLDAAGDG